MLQCYVHRVPALRSGAPDAVVRYKHAPRCADSGQGGRPPAQGGRCGLLQGGRWKVRESNCTKHVPCGSRTSTTTVSLKPDTALAV